MGLIELEGMEFYAYHGHFREEQVVGNRFIVDLKIGTDTTKAANSDNLNDALDYQKVYNIVSKEMEIKSFLLENIAGRLKEKLINEFPQINYIELRVSKINPPLGGKVQKVSVVLKFDKYESIN